MLRKTLIATWCTAAILSLPMTASAATQEYKSEQGTVTVSSVAEGLNHPWALAFLPDKQGMLVTERSG
ncbi:PQQ-dependent sugar dehydrogenase, partial [Pseudomonas tremae]|nr:PQQ-dependent sugar dehydrogenase [Pseudomonas tremae]